MGSEACFVSLISMQRMMDKVLKQLSISLGQNGFVHKNLSLQLVSDVGGLHLGNETSGLHRGVVATGEIPAGTLLIRVPQAAAIWKKTITPEAWAAVGLPVAAYNWLRAQDIIILFLAALRQVLMGRCTNPPENVPFAFYVCSLPEVPLASPLAWPHSV